MNASGSSLWPTARASEQENRTTRSAPSHGNGHGMLLAGVAGDLMGSWPTPMAGTPAQNGNSAAGNSDFSRKAEDLAWGLWGTPRGSDGAKGGPNQKFGAGGIPLPAQAAQWPTPSAMQDTKGDTARVAERMQSGKQVALAHHARSWPTPASRDYRTPNSEPLVDRLGTKAGEQLPNAVAHGFILPDLPRPNDGPTFSERLRISRQLRAYVTALHGRAVWRRLLRGRTARRLNPLFVEWLMGFPEGLLLCAAEETEFTRWQQDMRGALCRLPMASGPWIWMPQGEAAPAPAQMSLFGGSND